jgi:hypothetical protein
MQDHEFSAARGKKPKVECAGPVNQRARLDRAGGRSWHLGHPAETETATKARQRSGVIGATGQGTIYQSAQLSSEARAGDAALVNAIRG